MNSRTKGHGFERVMAERLRELWPDCYTTRFKGSSWLDHTGVDLTGTPGYNIQVKATERTPSYHDILASMPKNHNTNIVVHKRNNRGIIVAISFDDFLTLLKKLKQ